MYEILDPQEILSPSVVIFREILDANLQQMLAMAGGPQRLRPHCKTHKMPAVVRRLLQAGITRHKCATLAEAEMLAESGVRDIVLAYNIVGPNLRRVINFRQRYPDIRLVVTADHSAPIRALSEQATAAGVTVEVLLDIDTGQHRTGVPVGTHARTLYEQLSNSRGIIAAGFHVYDGHQHQPSRDDRRVAVMGEFNKVRAFRDSLVAAGFPVPLLLCGGTASFPIYAEVDDPTIEFSPGTCIFHDAGYSEMFPDLKFQPATLMLTRCISRPTSDRVTFDLGYKAVASDPPAGKRLSFPTLPDAVAVLQNEEHLVLQTSQAEQFQPGDILLAIPRHICPTCALYRTVTVIAAGRVVDHWDVVARDRFLTI